MIKEKKLSSAAKLPKLSIMKFNGKIEAASLLGEIYF